MKRGSRIDELFTLLFMILAIGAIVCYFAMDGGSITYLVLGGIAIVLRVAQYIMRFF
ncbi:MAG: hypothetical protein LBT42_01835 [Tannerella sp.]|jgi:hypothetical protein|nr:hypothetical protein [Tannerella sp.]